MPKPYSEDLRERVMKVVDEKKMRMKEISRKFNIDEKTLYWWRKRREKKGNVKPEMGHQKGHSHKIKDLDRFVRFIEEKEDITVNKLIEEFGNMHKNTVSKKRGLLN